MGRCREAGGHQAGMIGDFLFLPNHFYECLSIRHLMKVVTANQ
jgi:hypothetical protein